MLEHGRTTKWRVKVSLLGRMEEPTRGLTKMIKRMDLGCSLGKTISLFRLKFNSFLGRMETLEKVSGSTEN